MGKHDDLTIRAAFCKTRDGLKFVIDLTEEEWLHDTPETRASVRAKKDAKLQALRALRAATKGEQ